MDKADWVKIIVLAVLALAVFLAGKRLGQRREDGRAAKMMKKYRRISRAAFDAIAEGERVDAVVSRVLARAEEARLPQPINALAELPHANTVVYTVWAVCREMASGSFSTLMSGCTGEIAELADEAFADLPAPQCATAWRALLDADREKDDIGALERAFAAAVQSECPLTLCEGYILDHAEDFIDGDEQTEG